MPVNGKHLLHYVPHGINSKTFHPLEKNDAVLKKLRKEYFGETQYEFVVGFNSRNSHRKHPSNLILGFKTFCDHLPPDDAKKCVLLMHTDKSCSEGTDLIAVTEALCPQYKVIIDDSRKSPEEMCGLYNLFDMTANISSNEGFGLSIAESIMCGTPVIASVTGGLQDQLGFVDDNGNPPEFNLEFGTNVTGRYKKHGSWAKPLWTATQTVQGSPPTPYIMDDFVDYKQIADGIMYWYLAGNEIREKFGLEGREWALNKGGINSENMCNEFIKAMDYTIDNFTPPKKFDMFVYSEEFNIKRLPQDKVGFDTHKINIEQLEQELKQKST